MDKGGAIAALVAAKLVCCLVLPLAAVGALGGVAAWFAEVPAASWALLALAAVGGAAAWRRSANRARCCDAEVGSGESRAARPGIVTPGPASFAALALGRGQS